MRPSSLGGGRILRRTLSVRLSVRPVVVAIGNVFWAPLASWVYFSARTEGRISYGHLGRTDSCSGSNRTSARKNWPFASRISRSVEPTRVDRLPMTSCCWSVVTMGLSRTVSEINGDFSWKSQSFPPSAYLASPLRWFPLKFCNGGGAQKTSVIPLLDY